MIAPKMEKLTGNAWLSAMWRTIIRTLPMVLVGSLITIYNVIKNFIPALPVLTSLRDYTFGLVSIFMVFLIPYYVLELKKNYGIKLIAGFTGMALFMVPVSPEITDADCVCQFSALGVGDMFVTIIVGLFTTLITNLYGKFTFFKQDSVISDFMREWFDSMLPIVSVVLIGWLVVIQMHFDLYTFIVNFFALLDNVAQSLPGTILLYLIPTILYSMGVSGWVFQPIINPIAPVAITASASILAAGMGAPQPFINEAVYIRLDLNGYGATLPLFIMLLFAVFRQLRALDKASIVPSILNINESVVFGCVTWNPLLTIPTWIVVIILPVIAYFAQATELVITPAEVLNIRYCSVLISSWLVNHSLSGLVFTTVGLAVATTIFFPFFKTYDRQQLKLEMEEND